MQNLIEWLLVAPLDEWSETKQDKNTANQSHSTGLAHGRKTGQWVNPEALVVKKQNGAKIAHQ